MGQFTGFTPNALFFLDGIRLNNTKLFFEEHRAEYEQYVKQPAYALAMDLAPTIARIDPELDIRPARAVSRIRRDARYCKDSLYRDNVFISWKLMGQSNSTCCTYYFYITPEIYGWGVGLYGLQLEIMNRLRRRMAAQPEEFISAVRAIPEGFELSGPEYKRPPASAAGLPENLRDWYMKKSFYVDYERPIDSFAFSADLPETLARDFTALSPLYHMIADK